MSDIYDISNIYYSILGTSFQNIDCCNPSCLFLILTKEFDLGVHNFNVMKGYPQVVLQLNIINFGHRHSEVKL